MTDTVILEERSYEGFELNSNYGYVHIVEPAPFTPKIGEIYTVVWDGLEYLVEAKDADSFAPGAILLGNGTEVGLGGNKEPFAIGWFDTNIIFFAFLDSNISHRVAIYLPEGIVLKDRNGNDVAYYGIETVTFDTTTEGKQQTFTKGVAVEGLEFIPDFSAGDMIVMAPAGALIKSAVVKMPENLRPDIILEGESVCGIAGTLKAGAPLPAGVYWEVLDIPRPNNYYQRWFEYQGDLYAITNKTTGTAAIGYIYKLVNGAWTAVVSGLNLTTTDAYNIGLTEFNGKIHMCGGESTHHYIFDGTSLTRMADVANRLAKSMFVHNNQLKAYSYYDGTVYVWDEASDTWTAEATPGSKYDYYEFYNVNGIIYVYRSNNLYIYDNGTLTQIGSWSGTPGKIAIFDDTLCGLAWQSNRPYVLTQYDFATNQYRTIGTIPHYNSQTTLFEYQGRLCALAPNNTDYFAAWVLHEVAAA